MDGFWLWSEGKFDNINKYIEIMRKNNKSHVKYGISNTRNEKE